MASVIDELTGAVTREIGEYTLRRRVAVGGMGEIYEAQDSEDQTVALKVLLPQCAKDPEFVQMFIDEARVNAALNHPNLVRVYEYGRMGGTPFLAMEMMDGPTLAEVRDRLKMESRSLPHPLVFYVMGQLLEGLAYVHEATHMDGSPLDIVHRDVTPHNVLMNLRGEVKLGDFGIARSSVRDTRTRTGMVKGKLGYLAPEQATGSKLDHRTDLYAAGLILYELLCGRKLIRGDDDLAMLRAAESPTYVAPSTLADVPKEFDGLVERALKRFPEERYPSARAFLERLRTTQEALGMRGEQGGLVSLLAELPDPGDASTELVPPMFSTQTVPARPASGSTRRLEPSPPATEPPPRRFRTWLLVPLIVSAVAYWGLRPPTENAEDLPASPPMDLVPPSPATKPPPPAVPDVPMAKTKDTTKRPQTRAKPSSPLPTKQNAVTPRSPETVEATTPDAPDLREEKLRQYTRRLDRLEQNLQKRGFLLSDLAPAWREERARVRAALTANETEGVELSLEQLEDTAASLQLDRKFLQSKLSRTNQLISRSKNTPERKAELKRLETAAVTLLMDGKLSASNEQLNRIWKIVKP